MALSLELAFTILLGDPALYPSLSFSYFFVFTLAIFSFADYEMFKDFWFTANKETDAICLPALLSFRTGFLTLFL